MASEKIINQKKEEVANLAAKMKEAKIILLTDYRGINVADVTELRSELRKSDSEYKVIKNNIIRRALAENGIEGLDDLLEGPTAVIMNNEDYLEAAKAIEVDGKTIETTIAEASGKIGEKLSLRRIKTFTKNDDEVFGAYSHMGGKMVSIVKLADGDEEKARDIAMHVAAINPKYISQDEIPQVEKDREDAVQTEIMANDPKLANKPEKVLEGIKRGKLNKVFSEWCLLDQEFIKTPKESVAKYLGKAKVLEMARFQVGEGIEKKEENFAEEVAAQMKQ